LEGKRVQTDWVAQRSEAMLRYERWRDNALVEAQMEPMAQRYWGLEEFALALRSAGFGDIAVAADYARGRAPRERTRMFTFEARRLTPRAG
jgi:hypothetical protein